MIRRLTYPLKNTAFGLGDYSTRDTAAEADAWLSELLQRSRGMPGELTVFLKHNVWSFNPKVQASPVVLDSSNEKPGMQVHVYDIFGAKPQKPGAPDSCGANTPEFDHYCPRPRDSWWPALERFHSGGR